MCLNKMSMSLSMGPSLRMEQKLKMGFPTQIMCLLPLLNISLSNLSSIRNEVAKMTPDELKIFETLSRGGSGAKAFFDTNLEKRWLLLQNNKNQRST